jgi:hypothetical protein
MEQAMDDEHVWSFETSLWKCDGAHYHKSIDPTCLMVLPTRPYIFAGPDAIQAVSETPRWTDVEISDGHISRPQEGMIVVAYTAKAKCDGVAPYEAHCTSTYRRRAHDDWRVTQHQQTVPGAEPVQATATKQGS